MRKRSLVLLALLLAAPAHARPDRRVGYACGVLSFAAAASTLLGVGIKLRLDAPNDDTLMRFKRDVTASDVLLGIGTVTALVGLVFSVLAGVTWDLSPERSPTVWVTPSGGGLAWQGRF